MHYLTKHVVGILVRNLNARILKGMESGIESNTVLCTSTMVNAITGATDAVGYQKNQEISRYSLSHTLSLRIAQRYAGRHGIAEYSAYRSVRNEKRHECIKLCIYQA